MYDHAYILYIALANPTHHIQYVVPDVIAHIFDKLTFTADEARHRGQARFLLNS